MACRLHYTFPLIFLVAAGCGGGSASHLPKPRNPDDAAPTAAAPAPSVGVRPAVAETPAQAPAAATAAHQSPGTAPGAAGADQAPSTPPVALSEVDRRRQTIIQLTRIGRALEDYRKDKVSYPEPFGFPGHLSWRVVLLPLLGDTNLLRTFDTDLPWDHNDNRRLLPRIPDVFRSSGRTDGKTNVVLLVGADTAYASKYGPRAEQFLDGMENTILAVAVDDTQAVPWTAPQDYTFDPQTAQQALFGLYQDCCYALFGGATGVRRIPANISDDDLKALLTPAGGEVVDVQTVTRAPTPDVDTELLADLREHPLVRFAPAPESGRTAATAKPQVAQPGEREGVSPTVDARVVVPPAGLRPAARLPSGQSAAGPAAASDGEATSPASPSDERLPVPDESELQQAAVLCRGIYGDQHKAARTPEEKRALAKKMLEQSGDLAADPAGTYVLLRAARETAALAGDVDTAFHVILELAAMFRVEPLPLQVKTLEQAALQAGSESQRQAICNHALRLGDQALTKDDFAHAQRLFALAQNLARRDRQGQDLGRVFRKLEELQRMRTAQQRINKHAYTLVRTPDDPAANAAVGKYLCLVKRDWDRGLARLVRGDDAGLRRLAQTELRRPATNQQVLDLADLWWDWADNAALPLEQVGARQRAAEWYRKALPGMAGSLLKTRAEQRIAQADADLPAGSRPAAETAKPPEG
jgi:hypothetical protein